MNIIKFQNKCRELMNNSYAWLVRGSFGAMGKNCTISLPFKSSNTKDIFLGNRVWINAGAWIDCFTEYAGQQWHPKLEIGDDTGIGYRSHIMVIGHMKIGKKVMIANNVYISDNLHGFENIDVPIVAQPLKHATVEIEDDVWLGENVCVLPGVTIGRHSVIGANSVVTKDIPPYSVAVGSPAKVIKQYNHDSKQWETLK